MKRKNTLKIIAGISLVLIMAGMLLLATPVISQAKTLKIGVLESLTGWFSVHDVVDANEVKIVAEMINERGGITIKGKKYNIELIIEDAKSTLDGVNGAATKLAYDHRVKFVIGPNAFFSAAASPVFEPNKILHISGYATNTPSEVDASTPFGFLGYNGSVGNAYAGIMFLKKNYPDVKKVVFVHPDDGAIPYIAPIVKTALEANGISIVGDTIKYPNTLVDFSPIVTKINARKDADAVFHLNGFAQTIGPIVKGLRERGNYKLYAAPVPTHLSEIVTVAGKEATTNIFACGIDPNNPDNTDLMKEMIQRIEAKHGKSVSILFQGANSLWILKEVIEAAQSIDPAVVKSKWESMDTVETLFGTGIIGGDKTYGIKHHVVSHPIPFQTAMNGKVSNAGLVNPGPIP